MGPALHADGVDLAEGAKVTVAVRPENLWLVEAGDAGSANVIEGEVTEVVFLGDSLDCRARVGPSELGMRLHPSNAIAVGDAIRMRVNPGDVAVLAN
jgi:iron(III) transport system ATP-binding protein